MHILNGFSLSLSFSFSFKIVTMIFFKWSGSHDALKSYLKEWLVNKYKHETRNVNIYELEMKKIFSF